MEAIIAVAVIRIFAAAALPRYLGARNTAQTGTVIGELISQSKDCAIFKATTGIGTTQFVPFGAAPVACSSSASQIFSRSPSRTISGICYVADGTASSVSSVATATAQTDGTISCALT